MKRLYILTILLFLSLSLPLVSSAQKQDTSYRTYEVIEVTEKTITLRDKYGNEIVLDDRDPKDYKVGDVVRYDRIRNRLHKKPAPRTY